MLLDEPESALDFRLRYETMDFTNVAVKNNAAALVTPHDPSRPSIIAIRFWCAFPIVVCWESFNHFHP